MVVVIVVVEKVSNLELERCMAGWGWGVWLMDKAQIQLLRGWWISLKWEILGSKYGRLRLETNVDVRS